MSKKHLVLGIAIITAALGTAWAFGQDGSTGAKKQLGTATADALSALAGPAVAEDKAVIPFFGNEKCPFTGKPVSENASVKYEDQRAYFCCRNCVKKAKEDPKAAFEKAYAKKEVLSTKICPMTGQEIDPEKKVTIQYQGMEVDLCCGGCEKKFKKNPYLALVGIKYPAAKSIKNKICPIMDEEVIPEILGIYKNEIMHFCCDACIDDFKEDPAGVIEAAKKLK